MPSPPLPGACFSRQIFWLQLALRSLRLPRALKLPGHQPRRRPQRLSRRRHPGAVARTHTKKAQVCSGIRMA